MREAAGSNPVGSAAPPKLVGHTSQCKEAAVAYYGNKKKRPEASDTNERKKGKKVPQKAGERASRAERTSKGPRGVRNSRKARA
jgi:hypothetical protein